MQQTQVRSLGQEDLLKQGIATHSGILAWRIPWTEKPGGLQSIGLQRVGHDWATNTHPHNIPFYGYTTFCLSICQLIEGNGNPLQRSCLENPRDGGAWWAAVYGVAQSRTWLKRLSSSSRQLSSFYFLTMMNNEAMNIRWCVCFCVNIDSILVCVCRINEWNW